jgi:hypothetical protein
MLSMVEAAAIADLVSHLYTFLPASNSPLTFGTAADKAGVGEFWPKHGVGFKPSKTTMIDQLVRNVFERRRERFSNLVVQIVQASLQYRNVKRNPLRRDEISRLNEILVQLKIKIPDLHDEAFLSALASSTSAASGQAVEATANEPTDDQAGRNLAEQRLTVQKALEELHDRFLRLHSNPDRQSAGYALEKLLNDLFRLFDLSPKESFRVVGEQIDGSFYFEKEVYLLEARWTKDQIQPKDLYVFGAKVAGKSQFTRGVFVAINGYSADSSEAITKGKTPNFVMLDGSHLFRVLAAQIALPDVLLAVTRHLAEYGEPYLPVAALGNGLR